MSDGIAKSRLLARLNAKGIFSIITELSELDSDRKEKAAELREEELRRILRPHAEKRFGDTEQDDDDRDRRRRLDVALGTLTFLEMSYQTGVAVGPEPASAPAPELSAIPLGNLLQLFESEAFLRYINAYLYFGIRFLAWRLELPEWAKTGTDVKQLLLRKSNKSTFQLEKPPSLPFDNFIDGKLATLIHLSTSCDPAINPGKKTDMVKALAFLDGFILDLRQESPDRLKPGEDSPNEAEQYELWLRGLSPRLDAETDERFWAISRGIIEWTISRSEFYLSLQPEQTKRPPGGWVITNPLAARFALADVYWISRLLKAEVSTNAFVSYCPSNWLHLLRFRSVLHGDEESLPRKLMAAEEVLRSVFDFVCDLVQNAVEITGEEEKLAYEPELRTDSPETTAKWRKVFDEELDEIQRHRKRREFEFQMEGGSEGVGSGRGKDGTVSPREVDNWMQRLQKEKSVHDLIGLSFSGGGIRSATFNLGVLQGLQELDLLRKIDFISTVSGGGFIGAWLVTSVHNTKHWLGRLTNWDESRSIIYGDTPTTLRRGWECLRRIRGACG
jgi:hypothetical protein